MRAGSMLQGIVIVLAGAAGVRAQSTGSGLPPEECLSRLYAPAPRLASQYAPELYFADGEEHFPTIPFFTALDGRSNDADTLVDLYDLDEVAPPAPGHAQASWDALEAQYISAVARTGSLPPEQHRAVFYRIRCLDRHERTLMKRFLQKDAQAWRRNDMDTAWDRAVANRDIVVAEYYFYYLNDTGLEGHAEDIEFVYVFFPNDSAVANRFRFVVGAGHSPRTPNSVRFETREARLGTDIHVELGGHASVPATGAQRFEFGQDVNWNVAETWGPRDLMAVSGLGFRGGYEAEFSFERSTTLAFMPSGNPYRLLAIGPFETLARALEGDDRTVIRQALVEVVDEVWKGASPGTVVPPGPLSDSLLARLRYWIRPMHVDCECDNSASRHQIWEHRHYRFSPVMIFKDHLYRPSRWSDGLNLLTWGVGNVPSEQMTFQLGIVVPIGFMPLYIPGFIEVTAGIATVDDGWLLVRPDRWFLRKRRWTPMFSITYDNDYRDHLSWYTRLTWQKDPRGRLGIDAGEWSISTGPSLLIWSWDRKSTLWLGDAISSLRLRVGPRWYPGPLDDLQGRFALEFGLSLRQ